MSQLFLPSKVLRGWVILWMLAVPLFHVHPQADSHHGEPGHVHSGTVHTVFSPDLDGEYGGHDSRASIGTGPSHVSHPWQEHAELAFSLLGDFSDRKICKPFLSVVTCEAVLTLPTMAQGTEAGTMTLWSASVADLARELPSRAPPLRPV